MTVHIKFKSWNLRILVFNLLCPLGSKFTFNPLLTHILIHPKMLLLWLLSVILVLANLLVSPGVPV